MTQPRLTPLKFEEVTVEPRVVPRETWLMYFDSFIMNEARLQPTLADARRQVKTLVGTTPRIGIAAESSMKVLEGLAGRPEVGLLRRWTGLEKVPAVVEMVKAELEANAYDKIALFAVHKAAIEELRYGLRMFGAHAVYQGTPIPKASRVVNAFQADPRKRVIVRQLSAPPAALTAACQVGIVEASWLVHENAQAALQVHQRGQTRPVRVRFFVAPGYDAAAIRMLKQKTVNMAAPVDDDPFS